MLLLMLLVMIVLMQWQRAACGPGTPLRVRTPPRVVWASCGAGRASCAHARTAAPPTPPHRPSHHNGLMTHNRTKRR
jgi:hypothetical protein